MFNQNLMQVIQQEREREIESRLRVRRLLGGRRPFIRWRQPRARHRHQDG
jgi:hypothetical protein